MTGFAAVGFLDGRHSGQQLRHAVEVAPMGVRSIVGVLALSVAAAIGIGIAVTAATRSESRWCDDTASCPAEVLYHDQIYVVECTDHIVGFEQVRLQIPPQLRDQPLRVRYHAGSVETESRAWTVHGVDPAELIVLDERDTAICDGGPAFAYAWPTGGSTLKAVLQRLSVASTTTSTN